MSISTIKNVQKNPFFQISDEVNGLFYVMHNSYCKTKDLPFGNDCDKSWKIYDGYNNYWTDDESLTLECKIENI